MSCLTTVVPHSLSRHWLIWSHAVAAQTTVSKGLQHGQGLRAHVDGAVQGRHPPVACLSSCCLVSAPALPFLLLWRAGIEGAVICLDLEHVRGLSAAAYSLRGWPVTVDCSGTSARSSCIQSLTGHRRCSRHYCFASCTSVLHESVGKVLCTRACSRAV